MDQRTESSPDLVFADGFEAWDLSTWSSSANDGGDLSVSASAALAGSYGLLAVLDDNIPIYLQDDTPNAEARYRARFYLDPNSVSMSNGNAHLLFRGLSGSTAVQQVEFRRSSYTGGLHTRVVAACFRKLNR